VSGRTFGFDQVNGYLGQMKGKLDRSMKETLTDATLAIEGRVKSTLASGRKEWPSLAASTIAGTKRGERDHLLNVTGHMMRSVTHEIGDDVAIVGSPLEYAPVQEYGSKRAGRGRHTVIPARPHYQPAAEEALPGIKTRMLKRVESAGKR
jgi:phage gpG-like protein